MRIAEPLDVQTGRALPGIQTTPQTQADHPHFAAIQSYGTSDFIVQRNTILGAGATNNQLASTGEPSLGMNHEDIVFLTGNWYASVSFDAGQTFSFIDPYTTFPASAGGFCCDQIVEYDPKNDMVFWFLQYGSAGGTNIQRLAVASADDLRNGTWHYYDFTPQSFGWPSNWSLDFPDMAVSKNFLYITSNAGATGASTESGWTVWRIPLSQLKAEGSITWNHFSANDGWNGRLTKGAQQIMYLGEINSSSNLKLFTWPDSSNTVSTDNIGINSFNFLNQDGTAPSPDGSDWAAFADSRCLGAWTDGHNIGFMWNAKQGGGFPYPYIATVELDYNKSVIRQDQIWNQNHAWLYPSICPNTLGRWGGTACWGGGAYYPNAAVFIADDVNNYSFENVTVTNATNGPSGNRWGDYFSTRAHPGFGGESWIAGVYSLVGGMGNGNAEPRFVWFGRGRDLPYPLDLGTIDLGSTYPGYFSFDLDGNHWVGVGVNAGAVADRVELDSHNDFSAEYNEAVSELNYRGFVVANGLSFGAATHYARVTSVDPNNQPPYWTVAQNARELVLGVPQSSSFGIADVIDVYQVYVYKDASFKVLAHVTSGTPDLALFLYSPARNSGTQLDYDDAANAAGPGGDETFTFTVTQTGWQCIVVVHENADVGSYALSVDNTLTRYARGFALSYRNDVIPSTTLTGTNGRGKASSNVDGFYQLPVPDGWSGDIFATAPGYGFVPDHVSLTNVTSDVSAPRLSGGQVMRVGEAKQQPDSTSVYLGGKVVTGVFGAAAPIYYVEETDRSAGIQAQGAYDAASLLNVGGLMATGSYGRYIDASAAQGVGTAAVAPLGVTGKSLGGAGLGLQMGVSGATGLNNIGLLVRRLWQSDRGSAGRFLGGRRFEHHDRRSAHRSDGGQLGHSPAIRPVDGSLRVGHRHIELHPESVERHSQGSAAALQPGYWDHPAGPRLSQSRSANSRPHARHPRRRPTGEYRGDGEGDEGGVGSP